MAKKGGTINRQGVVLPVPPVLEKLKGPSPSSTGSRGSRPVNERLTYQTGDEHFYGDGAKPPEGDGRDIDVSGTSEISGNVPETRQSGKQDPAEKTG